MGKKRTFAAFPFILCTLAAAGCPGSIDNLDDFLDGSVVMDSGLVQDAGVMDTGQPDPCDAVVANVLSNPASCALSSCHDNDAPSAGLDLISDNLLGRLTGTASPRAECNGALYIDADTPEDSLLYTILLPDPPCSQMMPLIGTVEQADIQCVLTWIQNNASN